MSNVILVKIGSRLINNIFTSRPMHTPQFIEEKIVLRIREMVPAEKLPKDIDSLLTSRLSDLPLDSLDLLTLAMKLEDDLGKAIEVDVIDDTLSVSELAETLSSLAE